MSEDQVNVEELLQKAKKPAADALKLHPFYKGKMETTLKCTVRDIDDFAIWYTPGVAAPCREIHQDPEKVYQHTSKGNTIAVVASMASGQVTSRRANRKGSGTMAVSFLSDPTHRRFRKARDFPAERENRKFF